MIPTVLDFLLDLNRVLTYFSGSQRYKFNLHEIV